MAVARFLQISDLHLGSPFNWLPADRRVDRRKDQRAALEQAVAEAIERGVHAILLPGDLFDHEGVDADSLAFALHAFDVTGCPPVMISPGNHDPYSETSPYWSTRLLEARGYKWPEHVHVFTTAEWSMKPLAGVDDVRIWGRCFTPGVPSADRPLASGSLGAVRKGDRRTLDIGVFHGSREGKCPPGQKVTAPFSDDEAMAAPFAYMAAGHYHGGSRIDAHDKTAAGVRLAYAGSPVALDMTELGMHGALEVAIEYGPRQPFIEIDFVQLDRRQIHELEVDLSNASSAEDVDRRLGGAIDEAHVTGDDLVTVRLRGRLMRGVRYSGPGHEVASRTFYMRVDRKAVRPDYDLDAYRANEATTTEERFARALLDKLDAEKDPRERAIIEGALYYGLDAFRLREVMPAYEEFGE